MEKKKSLKYSLICNILIVLMTIFASIVMFFNIKFMHGYDVVLESSRLGMFRFFTVQSNILMGIVALLFSVQELKVLFGKTREIPLKYYVLKLASTGAVALTFVVVFAYLGNIAKGGLPSLLMNSNLFFHLFIPIFSIITFILFERTKKINFKYTLYGIIPSFLYELYYIGNILVHMENNKVSPEYDWYYFVQNGVSTAVFVAPIMLLVTYVICVILWCLNKKSK